MEDSLKTMTEVLSVDDPLNCSVMMDTYTTLNNKHDKNKLVNEETAVEAKEQFDIKKIAENSVCDSEQNLELTHAAPHLISRDLTTENKHIPSKENENIKVDSSLTAVTGSKRKLEHDTEFLVDYKKKLNPTAEEKKIANLRRNIRDVMGENQLDTNTLVAQREESDRLARVAEQQKIIREYQRQTAVNKQNVRTQNRVLSLLQSANTFVKVTDLTEDCPLSITPENSAKIINTDLQENNGLSQCNIYTKKDDNSISIPSSKTANVLSNVKLPSNDIVTIEDSSSEDDCILLSDDEEEDLEQDIEDDPSNSGLHVKDVYNVPDEKGRVVVNVGHPEGEEDIFLAPQIAKTIKPHQIGGVRFLFDNIIESTKRFNSSTGFGCILAHSMGLGKTLQVVCFCDIFLRHTDSKTVLCVMPINTLQNWVSEFNMWIPLDSTNSEEVRPRTFNVFVLNDQQKTLNARGKIIIKWAAEGGVLLMGYELFRLLALKLIPNRKRRVGKNCGVTEKVETEAHKRLTESIYQALVKPGPDLVICDEGHRIKNSHAGISLALKQIRSRRRIVLTGYPLQNNLMEYWCMVDFVRPNYLGTRTEFSNMFERPIQNGQCIDSTPEDIKLMRYRAHVLHSLLVGFVQRRSHVVLQHTLPQKLEYVILTKMNEYQRKLYDTFMNDVVRKKTVPNPLKAFAVCCKIWNHPDVLYNFLKKRETDLDLEIDDPDGTAESLKVNANKTDDSVSANSCITQPKNQNFDLDSATSEVKIETELQNKELLTLNAGGEKSFFMQKKHNSALYSDSGIVETKNLNKIFPNDYFSQNYYQSSNTETYIPECNEDTYWHDSNTQYYGYHSLCSNIGPPQKPDYVGMVVKEDRDLQNLNSSSQIVDLDTKEIKIVETDIDLTTNQIVNNSISCKTKSTILQSKNNFGQYKELCKDITLGNTQLNLAAINNLSSSNKQTSGLLTSFEKESAKVKSEDVIPYDWAADIIKGYEPNLLRNSPKMEIFFCILNESIKKGDRVLLFSQSLLTLNLIEKFLQSTPAPDSNHFWARNVSYFRLDGSTASQEREKLVNDFNSNPNIVLFLISTKAGSLGINLVGANRVIVFDASWNPCHDTQAVYRIYRYGQKKPCFVYRIVMDKCLEKKIYDRQVKKQGMSDRVVDECNPDAHLSMKDVTNLCYDYDTDNEHSLAEFQKPIDSYTDTIIQKIIENNKDALSKEPFHHESLLIDRKEKKLSLAEKRQAQRGYELEKKASSKHLFNSQPNKLQYRIIRNDGTIVTRPVASVRPMQTVKTQNGLKSSGIRSTRWIPAEVWQRQGMTAQEMTLPLDVVIPTNSSEKSNIILKSGQRVMVLKSPKGIYMQLESGKIIAIRTSSKINHPLSKNQKESVIDISPDINKRAKQTGIVKDNIEIKSAENISKNDCRANENPKNKASSGLHYEHDRVVKSTEQSIKSSGSNNFNQQTCQSPLKKSSIAKPTKSYEDFGANKMPATAKRTATISSNGSSSLSPLTTNNNEIILKRKENINNAMVHPTATSKEVNVAQQNNDRQQKSCRTELSDGNSTYPKITTPNQFVSNATEVKDHQNKINYVCNTTPDTFNPKYDALEELQISPAQKSPQPSQLQHQQHSFPQQHHQEQREPFVPVYNVQHSHYVDKVQQLITSHTTGNALMTSFESTPHRQYYDTIYDNSLPSYEYQHRYPNYPSHSSYTSPHQHYPPHFHNFNNNQANTITTHPYYMQWPPMSNVNQNNNQHNINSSCSQNGSTASQWHN